MINFLNINYILSHIRKTVDKYGMIEKGDKIAVGVSGGKDSLTLLTGLYYLSKFKDYDFDVIAVIIDCGFDDDYSVLVPFFEKINVDYSIVKTDIKEIVFFKKHESNPCALCSRFKRFELYKAAKNANCSKLALGHNREDVIDTFFMNLSYEGRIGVFSPVTEIVDFDLKVIRPLVECPEKDIVYFASKNHLPVIESGCPVNKKTSRETVHKYVKSAELENKGFTHRILNAIQESEIGGFRK